MATILKRENKNGVSYRIQVKVKNRGTGEYETKTATWQRPKEMKERESKKALEQFAREFEDSVKEAYNMGVTKQKQITLKQYAEIWLESLEREHSVSYIESCRYIMKDICAKLGAYKLKEISPIIVQKYIDELRNSIKVRTVAVAKRFIVEYKELNISREEMSRRSGVATATISAVTQGRKIEVKTAEKLSKAIGKPTKELFDIIREEENYSTGSLSKRYRTLRSMLSCAMKQQFIERNFAKSEFIRGIKEVHKEKDFLDEEQSRQLVLALRHNNDIRIRTALLTLLFTGMRRGELCGLEWRDINFKEQTIKIERSCTQVTGRGVVTGKTKTVNSNREIAISNETTQMLKEYKKWWEVYTTSLGDRFSGCQRLFIQADSKQLSPATILFWLKKTLKENNLPRVNVHSLRHTNISLQIAAGVPLKVVSARAGHSDTKVTSNIYTHMLESSNRDAASKLDQILG